MAETTSTSATESSTSDAPKKGGSLRLLILLGILLLVAGWYLFDNYYMFDQVEAAETRLNKANEAKAEEGVSKDAHPYLTREEVQAAIGFAPSSSKVENKRLSERYRWWGPLPIQNRYIVVNYQDEEGKRYDSYQPANSSFFRKSKEEREAAKPPANAPSAPPADETETPDKGAPADESTPPAESTPTDSAPPGTEDGDKPESTDSSTDSGSSDEK